MRRNRQMIANLANLVLRSLGSRCRAASAVLIGFGLIWAPAPTWADEPNGAPAPQPAKSTPEGAPPDSTPSPGGEPAGEEQGGAPAPREEPFGVPKLPRKTIPHEGDAVQLIFVSGDSTEGKLLEIRDDGFRVLIGGLEVNVGRSDLEDMIVLPPVEERFRQMRALIKPDEPESMSALANWAYERGLHQQALDVVNEAMIHEPNDIELRALRDMLEAQVAMDKVKRERRVREAEEGPTDGDGGVDDAKEAVRVPRPWPEFPLLEDEQIELMKVYEIDLRHPPRIVIERSTIDTLLQSYASNPLIPTTREGREAFARRSPAEILDVMFRLRARELYPEVKVLGHPDSMRMFRDSVQSGWLVNNCATNRCHGGEDAPDLVLFNRKPTAARSFYTNFLILERYRTPEGEPLIDYQNPDRSLLLQMGLPRSEAIVPHPDVPGWSPVFRSRDDRSFQRAVRWIKSMYRPRPEYPVEYTPPGQEPEAAPAAPEEESVER